MLMYILALTGTALCIFGVWLFRTGKSIEKNISQGPVTNQVRLFNNWGPNYILEIWGPNNTRPLAYLCVIVGTGLLVLFALSVT